jgi:hypothetical protein
VGVVGGGWWVGGGMYERFVIFHQHQYFLSRGEIEQTFLKHFSNILIIPIQGLVMNWNFKWLKGSVIPPFKTIPIKC